MRGACKYLCHLAKSVECIADRSEATTNHVDSDVEIPSDTVQRTIRKLELVRLLFDALACISRLCYATLCAKSITAALSVERFCIP